jgi:hypothetical protein
MSRVTVVAGEDIPAGMRLVTFNDDGQALKQDAYGHHSLYNRFSEDHSFPAVMKGALVEIVLPMQLACVGPPELKVVTCVFCGHMYPDGTPLAGAQVLIDHIKVCEKHPLRAAEKQLEKAEAESEGRRVVLLEKAEEARREWTRAEKAEGERDAAKAIIEHMEHMAARRNKLCNDYEKRLLELGEMLGARERERPAFIKSRDQLQKLAQFFEKDPADLFDHFVVIQDSLFNCVERQVNQGKGLAALNKKIVAQARELTIKEQAIKERNLALDALHWVWCSGGCHKGTHRFGSEEPITAEHVVVAERNTKRLREWFEANERRRAREAGQG